MATVKYFGILAETTNRSEEVVALQSENLAELVAQLTKAHSLEAYDFQVAVNRKIISNLAEIKLSESDEIAFLPAFAGG